MAEAALVVEDLHKSFGVLEVLKGISLTAHEQDVISILGSSGSGKSTLLRCINLLETPNSGKVFVHGELIRMNKGYAARKARNPLLSTILPSNLWPRKGLGRLAIDGGSRACRGGSPQELRRARGAEGHLADGARAGRHLHSRLERLGQEHAVALHQFAGDAEFGKGFRSRRADSDEQKPLAP